MYKHFIAAALTAASLGANAAFINASSATFAGNVVTFNDFDGLEVNSPLDLGNGVTLSSTPNAIVGQYAQDLGDNGAWTVLGDANRDGAFVSSAFTTGRGEIGFSFANPVAAVGAFVNHFQAHGQTNNSMLVVAYDVGGNILESQSVSIDTDAFGYDGGRFVGFQRAQADIYGFGFVDGTVVIDNLTSAVPEPSSWALTLVAALTVATITRRRT